MKVVIIGGGWSGCAAAIQAKKSGGDVVLIERTDLLLGLGNVGGIMRNNGRFTGTEEMIALGGGDLFNITDRCSRHRNINFPGHKHASLYDVTIIEPHVRRYIEEMGIQVLLETRVVDVLMEGNRIKGVCLENASLIEGDVFIETTGTTGPMGNCIKYGNGCSMCILRCPTYGPRVSISRKAGVEDMMGMREDGNYGAMSGSCKLNKDSLAPEVQDALNTKGVYVAEIPQEDINLDKLKIKVCQQYALKEFAENIVLLDTGHAKLMTSYYPLTKLRKIKGLENARYEDPYSGGKANSIRYLSVAPRTNGMKVKGVANLLCAGEKSGQFVGHTEAIVTGTLAGYNAVRTAMGIAAIELPRSLACGDLIALENQERSTPEGLKKRYTMAGSHYFARMQEQGLYSSNPTVIKERVERLQMTDIFKLKLT